MFTCVCISMPVVCNYKCVCLPETAPVWGGLEVVMVMGRGGAEQAAKSSAAPQSLRTRCSSLLAAMKSNQSPAFSPGLTSAFNYRTQQRLQHRERLPPLGHSQHVTAQTQGWGRHSGPLHTVTSHKHSVLKHTVGPDRLSVLLHRLGESQGVSML